MNSLTEAQQKVVWGITHYDILHLMVGFVYKIFDLSKFSRDGKIMVIDHSKLKL